MTITQLSEKLAELVTYLRQNEQQRIDEATLTQYDIDSLLARVADLGVWAAEGKIPIANLRW